MTLWLRSKEGIRNWGSNPKLRISTKESETRNRRNPKLRVESETTNPKLFESRTWFRKESESTNPKLGRIRNYESETVRLRIRNCSNPEPGFGRNPKLGGSNPKLGHPNQVSPCLGLLGAWRRDRNTLGVFSLGARDATRRHT